MVIGYGYQYPDFNLANRLQEVELTVAQNEAAIANLASRQELKKLKDDVKSATDSVLALTKHKT